MSSVVNDVLMIAQLEGGTFQLDWDEIDLCGFARETMEKFQGNHAERNADFAFDDAAHHIPVHVDIRSVEQMIVKLLSNAAKFSEIGTPIGLSVGIEKDGSARLSVKDNGIGMTEAEAEAAIRPFRQVDGRIERKYQGSGLGLSIVNKLIESHHGQLKIASQPGQGTEVSLYFPRAAEKPTRVGRLVAA
jgi:signal transduction histidine kinase